MDTVISRSNWKISVNQCCLTCSGTLADVFAVIIRLCSEQWADEYLLCIGQNNCVLKMRREKYISKNFLSKHF